MHSNNMLVARALVAERRERFEAEAKRHNMLLRSGRRLSRRKERRLAFRLRPA